MLGFSPQSEKVLVSQSCRDFFFWLFSIQPPPPPPRPTRIFYHKHLKFSFHDDDHHLGQLVYSKLYTQHSLKILHLKFSFHGDDHHLGQYLVYSKLYTQHSLKILQTCSWRFKSNLPHYEPFLIIYRKHLVHCAQKKQLLASLK